MKTEKQFKQDALAARIKNVLPHIHFEFRSEDLYCALAVDKYDVLSTLHQLRHEGVVEQLHRQFDTFSDLWRVAR